MDLSLNNIIILIGAYLLGSIPFAVVIGKVFYKVDIRKQGSGNPGATNTLRVLGKKAGLAVLLLDMAKGVGAVFMGRLISGQQGGRLAPMEMEAVTGGLAILGHVFSPFLRFKGGKGVATSTGVVLALQPLLGLIIMAVFFAILLTTRYVSLGSIISAAIYPVLNLVFYESSSIMLRFFSLGLALLIIIKHKDNISRLLAGRENKFGLKNSASGNQPK